MQTWLYRKRQLPAILRRRRNPQPANDEGFSFAQVIVTMVIVGILGGAIGFTAFQFIGQSRETVLAANIRTAADAVQNTLALNPNLKGGVTPATGAPSTALISELSNAAGFAWVGGAFPFVATDGVETVRIQMIDKGAAATPAVGLVAPAGAATTPPAVRWLVADWDAVRVQIKNEDNAWACALIVLRPDWVSDASGTAKAEKEAGAEGNLRGIWYDAGSNIPSDNGLHHCSPSSLHDEDMGDGTDTAAAAAGAGVAADNNDPLPVDGANWYIPADVGASAENDDTTVGPAGTSTGTIPQRLLQRTVPDFGA